MDYQIPANLKALKGPKGDKGDPGHGLVYNGVLASTDDLPVVAPEVNEAYLIAGDLWAWDGIQWINAGPVQGPPGPPGPRGLQGFPFDPETLRPIVVDELSSTPSVVAAAAAAVDANPTIAEHDTRISRTETRAIDVRDHGAVGGGLGTTVAAAGEDIAAIRTETGQAWLQDTDSMDLVAFYRAQVQAESTGRGILFPKDHYIFTAPGFLHSDVHVDLGGSIVENTVAVAGSRFTREQRVFLMGILAREDFDRFGTQGWYQTANNLTLDTRTLTLTSGTAPSIGDVLLIRTTAAAGTPTLPSYTTFNEVVGVSTMTVTLRWPIERAITAPQVVNYNKITTLKSALVGTGEPHAYYACANASLRNGTLRTVSGGGVEFNGALNCDIDIYLDTPKGQAVYGNALNRCRVRATGVHGGMKNAVEFGVGSALSTVDVDLKYSGDPVSDSGTAGAYNVIQIGEWSEQMTVRGRIDAGNWPCTYGVTMPQGNRNTVDVAMVCRGATQAAVAFASNTGTGNTVKGQYEISTATSYYVVWNAGGGGGNWLRDTVFSGDQSTVYSLWFAGPNLGGAQGVVAPEGVMNFSAGASGNIVMDSYIREGIVSGGVQGSIVEIKTAGGSYPPADVVTARTTSGAISVRDAWGATITNTGATAAIALSLPTAAVGMSLRFYRVASQQIKVRPPAGVTVGAGAAGQDLILDSDKAFAEIRCHAAGHWTLVASSGTITYV